MDAKKENDILEKTLAIAESGYPEAYQFLMDAYEACPESYGPQTLYFLSCLAGGTDKKTDVLMWLKKAISDCGWWYRPEVLEDDDLGLLKDEQEFLSLKAVSDARYAEAAASSKACFSWMKKTAENLFLAVHGNTQNAETARADWETVLAGKDCWQIETIQSGEPDGYGTYRWSYDETSYLPVADAMEAVQDKGYGKIMCGGFSAGCDMLLRAVTFTSARCDVLMLQSPWIPVLQEHSDELVRAIEQKNIAVRIFCGSEDEDCLPLAKKLYAVLNQVCPNVTLTVQENCRHQFPSGCLERSIDEEIRLIPYYRNDAVSLPWYQDLDVCKQVDNRDTPYDLELLHRMYDYLSANGDCYYIEYQGVLVGDVSLCKDGEIAIVVCKPYQNRHIGRRCVMDMIKLAREKGMDRVTANIYSFNGQSRKMFLSIGFVKTGEEWYVYQL